MTRYYPSMSTTAWWWLTGPRADLRATIRAEKLRHASPAQAARAAQIQVAKIARRSRPVRGRQAERLRRLGVQFV